MNWRSWPFHKKVWAFLLAFTYGSILIAVLLFSYIYQEVYLSSEEERLLSFGNELALLHEPGPLTDVFVEKVEAHNDVSDTKIYAIENPRELSACLPFEIDYQSFISEAERRELLNGERLVKLGYEPRIDRNVLAVIVPLIEDRVLDGILYVYVPVSSIQEVFLPATPILVLLVLTLFVVLYLVGVKLTHYLTKPITGMQEATQKIAEGDLTTNVPIYSEDELGKLARSFNEMAQSLQLEEQKKQQFLSNVSHELRTPLSYLKGYSEVLMEDDELKEDQKEYVKIIHHESSRLGSLVAELLDLARLQEDTYPLSIQPTALAALIEETIASYRPEARKRNITLHVEKDDSVIAYLDSNRIQQVLHNLLQNSLRHCQEQDVISVTMKTTNQHEVQITISDSGSGMSKEALQQIGERFYRTDFARTRKDGGSGLGIAISKAIIHKHFGHMNYDSVLGNGTTVTLIIPIHHKK
ncbi:sensor histidine kinase [Bacillus sp. FJAT-45037]|uniref:sensor histidine kinase n=1 Tax=Bacillus sp. FJAT-45037 TaxID=2011007 RepID=UPI000C237ABF|nr:ATP-binding protein [Bacillus sp. FJAT-45037]